MNSKKKLLKYWIFLQLEKYFLFFFFFLIFHFYVFLSDDEAVAEYGFVCVCVRGGGERVVICMFIAF